MTDIINTIKLFNALTKILLFMAVLLSFSIAKIISS